MELNKKIILKNILKNSIYKAKEEIILEKVLDGRIELSIDNQLQITPIEKKHSNAIVEFTKKYHHHNSEWIKIANHIKKSYNGFIAIQDNNIIGYVWWIDYKLSLQKNLSELKRYGIELNGNTVYATDLFIASQYRGSANAIKFLKRVFLDLYKLGYSRIIGTVDFDNIPAKWIYTLLEFKEVNRITGRRFFRFILFMNRSLFLKTSRWNRNNPDDFRLIYSLKKV